MTVLRLELVNILKISSLWSKLKRNGQRLCDQHQPESADSSKPFYHYSRIEREINGITAISFSYIPLIRIWIARGLVTKTECACWFWICIASISLPRIMCNLKVPLLPCFLINTGSFDHWSKCMITLSPASCCTFVFCCHYQTLSLLTFLWHFLISKPQSLIPFQALSTHLNMHSGVALCDLLGKIFLFYLPANVFLRYKKCYNKTYAHYSKILVI